MYDFMPIKKVYNCTQSIYMLKYSKTMSGINGKHKLSMLLMASLITANFVCASDTYRNNVVDVRVNKEAGNSVKVTIYTDKPYLEPVVVNKKANNKYVILMPETKSSLKASPTVTNGAGTISNVSVNTQAVNGGKGYTKITITSDKAINVVPRTQQLMTSTKPHETVAASKPVTTAQNDNAKKLAQQKAKQEAEKKALAEKQKQEQVKRLAEQKAKAAKAAKAAAEPKPVQVKTVKPAPVTKVAQTPAKEPIKVLENEIKTGYTGNYNKADNDSVLEHEINENLKTKKQQKKDNVGTSTNNKSVIENIRAVLIDFQNIGFWKLLLLAGAITLPVIVIMLILYMDKRINKKIQKSFGDEEDVLGIITDEDVPNEESINAIYPNPQTQDRQVYNSFDAMLDKVDEPVPSFHEEQLHQAQYERFKESVNEPIEPEVVYNEPTNDYVQSDFENETVQADEQTQEQYEQTVQPEQSQLPAQPYNPDGYLADFADVNDKDFFDELVMQTMADNNSDGLPEQSPADEIFNFMNEEEPPAVMEQEQDQYVNEQTVFETSKPTDVIPEETEVTPIADETVTEAVTEEPQQEEDVEENLTMLTEVKVDENTGLYLVNYDNFSSLVGHIKDDYFVIKKFDDLVNSRIILKQTEKLKDATRYLVRVGKNKMVVEISENSMSRLLDL